MTARTALVIGSHGFIGGYVCQRLLEAEWQVIGIDNINVYKPREYRLFIRHYDLRQQQQIGNITEFYRMDASQGTEFGRVIARHRPSVVINLGGTSVADVCKQNIDEAVSSIYLLNANVLQALKENPVVERYVYVSSSMVYGDFACDRPDEDAPTRPKDPYGAIKLGGELLVQSFHRQFDLPYAIVRPSAVYGPLDSNMRVTGIFMRNAHLGKPLRVNDPREQLDFTYVEDAADGIVLAATRHEALNETFNITRGEGRTIAELAEEVRLHFAAVSIQHGGDAEHMEGLVRPIRGALSIDKARRLLGYCPKYSLADGIRRYAQAWKAIYGTPGTPL